MSEFAASEPFDPSGFDPDAFLRESLAQQNEQEFSDAEEDLETVRFEGVVMATLVANGVDLGRLSESQALVGADKPLTETVIHLGKIVHYLVRQRGPEAIPELEVAIAGISSDIDTACRIAKIAIIKDTADLGHIGSASEFIQGVQAEIYADDALSPAEKAAWLATIATVLPDVGGLNPTDPEIVLIVDDHEAIRLQDEDIIEKSRALRKTARESLVSFMKSNNLGHHDATESLMGTMVVGLSRFHVVGSGNYHETTKEVSEWIKLLHIDRFAREDALAIGWTSEQFDAAVEYILNSLQQAEQE